jgi:hypothetical protein
MTEYGTNPRSSRRREGAVGPAAAQRFRGDVISLKCVRPTFAQIHRNRTEAHRREMYFIALYCRPACGIARPVRLHSAQFKMMASPVASQKWRRHGDGGA